MIVYHGPAKMSTDGLIELNFGFFFSNYYLQNCLNGVICDLCVANQTRTYQCNFERLNMFLNGSAMSEKKKKKKHKLYAKISADYVEFTIKKKKSSIAQNLRFLLKQYAVSHYNDTKISMETLNRTDNKSRGHTSYLRWAIRLSFLYTFDFTSYACNVQRKNFIKRKYNTIAVVIE